MWYWLACNFWGGEEVEAVTDKTGKGPTMSAFKFALITWPRPNSSATYLRCFPVTIIGLGQMTPFCQKHENEVLGSD